MSQEEDYEKLLKDEDKNEKIGLKSQNWRNQDKIEPYYDQSGPSKYDAIIILILVIMIGFSGFGLLKHYNVLITSKPNKDVRVALQNNNYQDSAVQDVFNKLSDGLQSNGDSKAPKEDEIAIDSVLDSYISKIEQYNDVRTEWIDDDDDINKKIEEKLEEQQNVVQDLEELIIQQESQIQILKPVFSKNIYTYKELQNGVKMLLIQSSIEGIHMTITLNIGKKDDPSDKPGLTELLFRCLQTNFYIEIFNNYTTLTVQLSLFEELNAKLQELYNILTKPQFIDIDKNANDLYNDLLIDSKSGELEYVSDFLSQQAHLNELTILNVDADQLFQQYISHISADTISLIFKTSEEQEKILDKVFQSDLSKLKNLHKFQQPNFQNKYPQGRHILKFRSDTELLTLLSMSDQYSCQRFLAYLLPKPFYGAIWQNHLLITLDIDLGSVLNSINKLIQFFDYLKQADENQLQYLYSQMLATEELLFNTKYEENLISTGQNLFSDPIYALKGQESLPIFDKDEFNKYLSNLANNFIVLVGSENFQLNSTYESQKDDSIFILDAILNKVHQGFTYDLKPLVKLFELNNQYQFQLPAISPFLPENLAIISVCQEPIYKIQGFGYQHVDDLSLTVKDGKFDGTRDPKFETVEYVCEFPMPDFQIDCLEKEKAAQSSLTPFQVASNVWWKPSRLGAMVFTGLFIEKPESTLAQGKTMLKLLQKYYTELSKRLFQQEFLFGYELSFKETINGLNVQILSYSEKQQEFQDKVFDLMSIDDEQLFYYVKDLLSKDIKRFHDQKLSLLTQQYYLPKIMLRPINTPQEILNVLDEVDYQKFLEFQGSLLSSKIEVLNIGNILPNDSVFQDSQETYLTRTLNLKGQNLKYIVQRESSTDMISSVLNYYQTGLKNIETTSKLYFYADFLQSYSNNYFKMGQQVLIKRKPLGCADGLQVYMQGVVPSEGNEEIEKFLKQANLHLSNLQDDDILDQKLYTINKLYNEIKFKSLQEEGQFIWDKIVNKNYAFSEISDVIRYLDDAFPQKLRECANLVMQGQMSVQVYAVDQSIENTEGIQSLEQLIDQDVYECFFTL
ncbi:unnamed protein product (macronuclear) [Paramecium tetraurelia]|uniref:Peptidase M16 middle/third domain-containing protein n=1 Tax=Paramecium tetraurelia TaxID=5888 RepID=A0BUD4_PARTE|nr:uncharacterized protein GSPATT00032383001 [Paramecium tetraurelia]CAK62151.1 unnamed protein product [Paramecium tetraurelia]|eukprot:XP_001429549.1 hypothetical protein (macronuclear) [Paramecium tetraurelia strain d4-2]